MSDTGSGDNGEFDRIARFWKPLADSESALGLEDDAALIPSPHAGHSLVIAKDALVAGTHFFEHDPLDLVARKLLRVNLSDMAAMGAEPLAWLAAYALPRDFSNEDMSRFQEGLLDDQQNYGLTLLGGDTTSTNGPLVLSCTMIGQVPDGMALRRNGARAGDLIVTSGPIGDAWLGLQVCLGHFDMPADSALALETAYHLPQPRLDLGVRLRGLATACADISDGLLQDAGHIATASGLQAVITSHDCPASAEAKDVMAAGDATVLDLLTGGDDYELVFTIPPEKRDALTFLEKALSSPLHIIGVMQKADGGPVVLKAANGEDITPDHLGWQHSGN